MVTVKRTPVQYWLCVSLLCLLFSLSFLQLLSLPLFGWWRTDAHFNLYYGSWDVHCITRENTHGNYVILARVVQFISNDVT